MSLIHLLLLYRLPLLLQCVLALRRRLPPSWCLNRCVLLRTIVKLVFLHVSSPVWLLIMHSAMESLVVVVLVMALVNVVVVHLHLVVTQLVFTSLVLIVHRIEAILRATMGVDAGAHRLHVRQAGL